MINPGDRLPEVPLMMLGEKGPESVDLAARCAGRRVVLFAVPGAFTPTCHLSHLPGYVVNADAILARGVDEIVCLSVNDPFVMQAWGAANNAERLSMLADPEAKFAEACGLSVDLSVAGLGTRSQRFAMIIDDGVVTHLAVEPGRELTVSSAEAVLEALAA